MIPERIQRAIDNYRPPHTGIHVALCNDVSNEFETFGSVPFATAEGATFFWSEAKAELGDETEGEIVVDLYINGDLIDTFLTRRQMVEPLKKFVAEKRSNGSTDTDTAKGAE